MTTPAERCAPGILYVSYDGVLEPLGESQVVSYLERLAADHEITLLSFEKSQDLADGERVDAMADRLGRRGITWIRRRYHKRPPVLSTAFDVLVGILIGRRACRAGTIAIVHARSYVPSLIALAIKRSAGTSFLFDMRGFWVDEKVEAGHWRSGGLLVRAGKWWERRFFESADGIVSLTEAGVRTFAEAGFHTRPSAPIEVIPTCVDLARFVPGPRDPDLVRTLGLEGVRVIGCVGTISNWYMRDEMLHYLADVTARFDDVRILMVTREDHARLRDDAQAAGIPGDRLVLTRAAYADMPAFTRLFDAGVFFIRPSMSKRGSAATKLGEFLGCGVPVIINDGVGDSGAIVKDSGVGVVLGALDENSMKRSLSAVGALLADSTIGARCRRVAFERFDLDAGVERYRWLYRQLASPNSTVLVPVS